MWNLDSHERSSSIQRRGNNSTTDIVFRRKIGFSEGRVKSFSRYQSDLSHNGCINTVKWSRTGEFLISGSDDRTVKLWKASGNLEDIKLAHVIKTKHRANIFCADISPVDPNLIISCAADGCLKSSYIDDQHAGKNLHTSDDIM